MDDEKLKFLIGNNIAAFRKAAGLTQAGLAEKSTTPTRPSPNGSGESPFRTC